MEISPLAYSHHETSAHRVLILSAVRAAAEGLAHGLRRYLRLDAVAHGATNDTLTFARPAEHPTTVVFDGSVAGELRRLQELGRTFGAPRVVVFGLGDGADDLRCCARNQVAGVVVRDAPLSELAEAIEAVSGGGHYTSASLIPRLMALAAAAQPFDAGQLARLTEREREVAGMLARTMTYAQIAAELCVSPATVKNHAHNIYRKVRREGGERGAQPDRWAPGTRELPAPTPVRRVGAAGDA